MSALAVREPIRKITIPPATFSRASSASRFASSPPNSPSLDDEDDVRLHVVPYAASSSPDVVHDPHAVKLCASLLSLLEQLKRLAERREDKVYRFAEEKPGADIYEVTLDRVQGSLSVKRVQEIVEGLGAATREARENLAHEIEKRKADIVGLEKELAVLGIKIQENQGEGVESLAEQLVSVHAMIGKHKKVLKELEGRSEMEVKVKVQRGKELLLHVSAKLAGQLILQDNTFTMNRQAETAFQGRVANNSSE
eukprot:g79175.t1